MVNYNLGKIYKIEPIVEHDEEDIYIGSTAQKYLCYRFQKHKGDYQYWKNGTHNRKTKSFELFDKYGIENCVITLIENVNVNTKEELLAKERDYIKTLKCINRCIPLRSHKEWLKDNAEKVKEVAKQYNEINKEKLAENRKNKYEENTEKYLQIAKQFRDNNREKINENARKKYHSNIEENRLKQHETVICECGCETTKNHLKRHQRSKKHLSLIECP